MNDVTSIPAIRAGATIHIVTRREGSYGPFDGKNHKFGGMLAHKVTRIAVCETRDAALRKVDADYADQPVKKGHLGRLRNIMGADALRLFAPIGAEEAAQGMFFKGLRYDIEEVPLAA